MFNYLNIHRVIEVYDREGIQGLKKRILKKTVYIEDNLAGEIYEMIKSGKYEKIHSFILEIKKKFGK